MALASSSHDMPRPPSSLYSSHGTQSSTVIATRTPSEHRCRRDRRHVAWRLIDSSEETPSTASSDSGIAPAELVNTRTASLQSCGQTASSLQQDRLASPTAYSAQLAGTTAEGTLGTSNTLGRSPWAVPLNNASHHNAPADRTRQQDEQRETSERQTEASDRTQDREFTHPSLYPLEPRYQPPQRRPTPPGVPSFEAAQQSLESRLALRRRGAMDGGPGGHADANGSAGAGNRGSFSFST
ncbi:hypothetical protein F503_08136 [Ophiostoma piceae UAMH 11346]|uniref:Uncharacterized protein n=1 Tax=Ophiostoma piceae (strain UAMH 11346) TaxID=1262450 RepID=S3D2H3_OPHP1|nr:hypothetical protein F503_08136 [Ophiostoma piceae UAMH 11346]